MPLGLFYLSQKDEPIYQLRSVCFFFLGGGLGGVVFFYHFFLFYVKEKYPFVIFKKCFVASDLGLNSLQMSLLWEVRH